MKYNFFMILATLCLIVGNSYAQKTGFIIRGTISGNYPETFRTDSIFLYGENNQMLASAALVNGKFELKGSVSGPQEVAVSTRKNGVGRIILENENYTYTWKDQNHLLIKGGTLHDMVMGSRNSEAYCNAVDDYQNTIEKFTKGKGKTFEELTPEERKIIRGKGTIAIEIESQSLNKVLDDPKAPVLAKVYAVMRIQQWDKYPLENALPCSTPTIKNWEVTTSWRSNPGLVWKKCKKKKPCRQP